MTSSSQLAAELVAAEGRIEDLEAEVARLRAWADVLAGWAERVDEPIDAQIDVAHYRRGDAR